MADRCPGRRHLIATDDLWLVNSTPVECGRSRETAKSSDLAGWAEYGYCATHSRYFWGCGCGMLVSSLIAQGLLDELHLFVNPTAIGAGLPVFPNLDAHQQLRLVTAQPFDCGITALHLEPTRS